MRDELKVVVRESGEPHWYALRVQPQKEYVVAYLLRKQDVRTFVPTETRYRRRTRYQKSKAEFAHSLIPSCVFAGFDGEPAWFHLLRNRLILGVEGHDGTPMRIDPGELHQFFASTQDGCMVIERGLRMISIPGKPLVRSPTTQVRSVSHRAAKPEEFVVEPTGRRARLLAQFALAQPQVLRSAA